MKRRCFACDLNVEASDTPSWHEGDVLVKSSDIMAGSAQRQRPCYPVRLLVFAHHACHADASADDPWHLMAVDRPACFVVADVHASDDATQFTLLEVDADEIDRIDTITLDDRAHTYVHRLFDNACSAEAASYETDQGFMRAVGTDQPAQIDLLLHPVDVREAQHYLQKNSLQPVVTQAPEAPTSAEEPTDTRQPEKAPQVDHDAYHMSDESWIVALAESILSESAAKSYIAADERSTQIEPDSSDDAPQVAAAASALYDTLHVSPQDEAADTKASAASPPSGDAIQAATDLYETLHLAEARLDETPDYVDIPVHAGLKFYQAHNRRLAAHPALEYAESQHNFERLLHRNLGGTLINRLYAGDVSSVSDEERSAEARRLWFDPLSQCTFFPLLSSDVDSYLEGMRAQYGSRNQAADQARLSLVQGQLDRIDAALHGDTDACLQLIEADKRRLNLPYRYEFSLSFDVEQRQVLINLFLPQKALFPLAMQAQEGNEEYSASSFNQRYQGVACALGIITMYLVKMDAAWVHEIGLNAWYRTEDDPKCVYSLRVTEQQLAAQVTTSTVQAFQALKDLKARMHSGNHHELLGLDPLFSLHEALDHPVGFKAYANGWTFPPAFTAITEEASAENLDRTISMLLDLLAQGKNAQAYEAARAHEQVYRRAWLDGLDDDIQPLSCENELEEQLALQLPSARARTVLPRKLGQLYHILGTLAHEGGNIDNARAWLKQALSLNPVGALSMIELAKIELASGQTEAADTLLDNARQTATSSYALAQVAKYRALSHAQHGRTDLAFCLYSYAYHLYESDAHQLVCLAYIRDLGIETEEDVQQPISLHPATPAPATLEQCIDYLSAHEISTGIADSIMQLVRAPVEHALEGGPLPDASYVDAYVCNLFTQGKDVESARSLVLNVHTVRFCDYPFSDYLFKPVLLCDTDIVFTIDHKLGLAPESERASAGLVAVPYIDPHAGLYLQVLGTADIHTCQPLKVLASPIKMAAAPFRLTPFRLLRAIDFPAFPINATADSLSRMYAPAQELDATRVRRDIDLLRDFSNPDNILVLLAAPELRPEGVWATLVKVDTDGTLYARLANEPYDDFGIHMGEVHPLYIQVDPDTGLSLAFMRSDA